MCPGRPAVAADEPTVAVGEIADTIGELLVSLPEIGALLRRHVLAILAVILVSGGVAYSFKHTQPTYAETGTMVLLPPISGVKPNPFEAVGSSLTDAAAVLSFDVMSPAGQQRVIRAGGTAQVDVELVNYYNLQYPNFVNPYLTITTTSTDPNAVHSTFTLVTKMLTKDLTTRQDVAPNNQILIELAGDTGPLIEQGSSKRALGGLAILTLIAIFAVAAFLDRHPIWRRRERAGARVPAAPRRPGPGRPYSQPGAAFEGPASPGPRGAFRD